MAHEIPLFEFLLCLGRHEVFRGEFYHEALNGYTRDDGQKVDRIDRHVQSQNVLLE